MNREELTLATLGNNNRIPTWDNPRITHELEVKSLSLDFGEPEGSVFFRQKIDELRSGLTPGLVEVADLLLKGYQSARIAKIRKTEQMTAKKQIKSIYIHHDINRHEQLLALVTTEFVDSHINSFLKSMNTNELSPTELQVLKSILKGKNNEIISKELFTTVIGIKDQVGILLKKIKLKSKVEVLTSFIEFLKNIETQVSDIPNNM